MAVDWQTFWLTLQLAATVSALLLLFGLPIAYWIAFSRWRWKFLVEAVVALPIVLPPTVLGFYVLVALGPRSPLGRWWTGLTGHTLFERPNTFILTSGQDEDQNQGIPAAGDGCLLNTRL